MNTSRSGVTTVERPLGVAIRDLIDESRFISQDRRHSGRQLCSCTASIRCDDLQIEIPAYVHDISDEGIGFIHGTRVDLGQATVNLNAGKGRRVGVRIRLVWCRNFGSGWFRSGGQLLELVEDEQGRSAQVRTERNLA